jgi:hypothetical protein
MRSLIVVVVGLAISVLSYAQNKTCPLGPPPPSDRDFTVRQRVDKTQVERVYKKNITRLVDTCLYSTQIMDGHGTLVKMETRPIREGFAHSFRTGTKELWITVRGLKDRREWTCPLVPGNITSGEDKWQIGDVLLFNALTIAYDDPTIPATFMSCDQIVNLTQEYPSQIPK